MNWTVMLNLYVTPTLVRIRMSEFTKEEIIHKNFKQLLLDKISQEFFDVYKVPETEMNKLYKDISTIVNDSWVLAFVEPIIEKFQKGSSELPSERKNRINKLKQDYGKYCIN